MKFLSLSLLLALVALGTWARFQALGERVFHTDEGVQGVIFEELIDEGIYQFDSTEYHGPTNHYLTLAWVRLLGKEGSADLTEADLRGVAVLAGLFLLLLPLALRKELGPGATLLSVALWAGSPMLFYYHRYLIHESLFVVFTIVATVLAWRFWNRPDYRNAALLGLAIACAHATKETFVFPALAAFLALFLCGDRTRVQATLQPKILATLLGAYLFGNILLFSSFFSHAGGPLASFQTYAHYLVRAEGEGHDKPFFFYLEELLWERVPGRLVFSEGLPFLGTLLVFLPGLLPKPAFARYLATSSLLTLLFFSLTPYKTIWSVLGVVAVWNLCAAISLAALLGKTWSARRRGAALAMAAALACGLVWQIQMIRWENFRSQFHSDPRNRWVYSHTLPNHLRMVDRLRGILEQEPAGLLLVIEEGYSWPLDWYLRRERERVAYYTASEQVPPDVWENENLVAVVFPANEIAQMKEQLGEDFRADDFYGLRPNVFQQVMVRREVWESYR